MDTRKKGYAGYESWQNNRIRLCDKKQKKSRFSLLKQSRNKKDA
jgi:hypothetical protein